MKRLCFFLAIINSCFASAQENDAYRHRIDSVKAVVDARKNDADQFGVAGSLNFLGDACSDLKQYDAAIEYYEKVLAIGQQIGAREQMKHAYSGLALAYEKKKELKRSFEYRLLFAGMKDSIYNDRIAEQIVAMQHKYETEKKEQQITLLNREQDIRNTQLNRQKAIIWSGVFILLVVAASGTYAYNRFRVAKRQKRIIEAQKLQVERAFNQLHEKNQEVLDSIHYARRIQRALITPERYIERVLSKLNKQ